MSEVTREVAKLDLSLEGFEVGISGAIPEREHWTEPAMDRGILEFVALLSGLIFKYGGRIIHGSHPSFTPVILRQARQHSQKRGRAPVTLVMSDLWYSKYEANEIASMTDIAEMYITKQVVSDTANEEETRNKSLTVMRHVLISAQNVMVAVGGKLHAQDGATPGVGEEMMLAEQQGIPRYLIGGLGGYASTLVSQLVPFSLKNDLPRKENEELFATNDVSACVGIVFQSLCKRYWTHGSSNLPEPDFRAFQDQIQWRI